MQLYHWIASPDSKTGQQQYLQSDASGRRIWYEKKIYI